MMEQVSSAAALLDEARRQRTAVAQEALVGLHDLNQAYAVQSQGMALRAERGERACGIKMGFTSRAKMAQMGVSELIMGQLTDAMAVDEGGALNASHFIHPRIEPEIAFRLSKPLVPGLRADELACCVDAIAPALEIIDSRYLDFRFNLAAVVADNSSAAAFVVGAWQPVTAAIGNLGLVMTLAGGAVVCGSTAAILGDPWRALAAAARLASQYGIPVPAGSVVLAGAATAAEPLRGVSTVVLEMAGLGRVQIHVEAHDPPTP